MVGSDGANFPAFYVREYPLMLRAASLIVGDRHAAEDVVQEGFARAYARWNRVSGYDKPGAWLRLVVVRLALRHRSADVTVSASAEGQEAPIDYHDVEPVLVAVHALPRQERAVVVLHYLCDQPIAEVARVLRVRPGTVRVQLHRARAQVGRRVERRGRGCSMRKWMVGYAPWPRQRPLWGRPQVGWRPPRHEVGGFVGGGAWCTGARAPYRSS